MPVKQVQYKELVEERKQCQVCVGLTNPSHSKYSDCDSEHIGPWTRLHGDLDAKLMIVGQDWGDLRYFGANAGMDAPRNPTTNTLDQLLKSIGFNASLFESGHISKGLFLTNAILCLKSDGLQAKVRTDWFDNCGAKFLRRQIELIRPGVVVTLGAHAHRAVCRSFGLPIGKLKLAVEELEGRVLPTNSRLVPVYHCGSRTLRMNRSFQQQIADWGRVRIALDSHVCILNTT